MDSDRINVCVNSEIGKLEHVLIHTPGVEMENMSPETAHKYLYSDILNLQVAQKEYSYFKGVLKKVATVHEISDMLADILRNSAIKENLVDRICKSENVEYLTDYLKSIDAEPLSKMLIEGVHLKDISSIDDNYFSLLPLPNLFFMRDASFTMFDSLMISNMATKVRAREAMILEAIYTCHPLLNGKVVNPAMKYSAVETGNMEGGDIHIVRDDIVLSGKSARTNMHGIQALVDHLKTKPGVKHLIFQELPLEPESFIHLDMVFTMLDVDHCMAYKPVIMGNEFKTFHITIDGNKAVGKEVPNLIVALNELGVPVEPIFCGGGEEDSFFPAREQWHSGTNFFCFAPGKFIGYARNTHTIQAINDAGYEVLKAEDVVNGKVNINSYKKCVVTFEGNELSRGGGGARCMTMPVQRQAVEF
ncbi:MAG: arginine deiminase [Bacteroidales bacterium]|nr:arginine deiminase [Bacteroidales bacterium]